MPASIFVFADLHLGRPGAPGLDWALQELEVAANSGATACVCLGDIIDRNVARARTFVDQHRTLADALRTGDLVAYLSALDTHLTNSRNQL